MTKAKTADLHCHLNGSFSDKYLETVAKKNNCSEIFNKFIHLKNTYLERTKTQPKEGYANEWINMIWAQFACIHQIIQTLDDITDGVVDVVKTSKAKYLEIRTTPKAMAGTSVIDYIKAFEKGLMQANATVANKQAMGILSLDRTTNTYEDAEKLVNYIKESPNKVLVGLDISGNPVVKRTITGESLRKVIRLALYNDIPIAIHMGEASSEVEYEDNNIILAELEVWSIRHSTIEKNALHGKVRLGHCIYLDSFHKNIIKKLNIPIEICPTCHKKVNWHLEKNPHPATSIYSDVSDPIVIGTDDEGIFGGNIKDEFNSVCGFFANKNQLTRKELKEHQADFRFGPNC